MMITLTSCSTPSRQWASGWRPSETVRPLNKTKFTTLEVSPVRSRADLNAFMKLPWRIYKHDPHWVPPLLSELKKVLDPNQHPFHQHAETALFLARRNGEVVGRISASV